MLEWLFTAPEGAFFWVSGWRLRDVTLVRREAPSRFILRTQYNQRELFLFGIPAAKDTIKRKGRR
jgi:hypothetical protein